jgi:hypothetical protein
MLVYLGWYIFISFSIFFDVGGAIGRGGLEKGLGAF